ncbi:hypothetical protein, partial [Planococcus faecalis]|uniref:hypothetical protein n=1 Tax=Planococcus faecalis TaxID=1598147 RepID=UPI001C43288F
PNSRMASCNDQFNASARPLISSHTLVLTLQYVFSALFIYNQMATGSCSLFLAVGKNYGLFQ